LFKGMKKMITRSVAEFIESTTYDDLSHDVVEQVKLCFLDFLGVSLRGSGSDGARIISDVINNGKVTVIGGDGANPIDAALINGVSAHSLDLDDGHRLAQVHPGACVIPAVLALAESQNKSGNEFITAIVVGYEVAIRLGIFLNPSHRQKGFHSTGTCGTIGAAAAAAKILDLDEEEILNTLGLAGTQAAGLLESDHAESMGKYLHAGRAAQSGVFSALLARSGFTGAHTILEGDEGLLKAMGDFKVGIDSHPQKGMTKSVSGKFGILGVYFKKYPVCRHLHSSLDAILGIVENENIEPGDIQDINVETYEIAAQHNNYNPTSVEGVRQSLPMTLALAIVRRSLNVEDIESIFQDRMVEDNNEIRETANKIRIKSHEEFNKVYPQKRPSKVTIKSRYQSYQEQIDLARGEPENPFTKNELLNKFHTLNPHVDLSFWDVLEDLEDLNLCELMNSIKYRFNEI
jgi:2-methylcitrate dehydratase PrpD